MLFPKMRGVKAYIEILLHVRTVYSFLCLTGVDDNEIEAFSLSFFILNLYH